VCIDSSLEPGHLTYAEYVLGGETLDEFLISCHICHPSLANDNLSGLALAVFLAKHLEGAKRRYSYRFLFIPGTIGSITWLALNEDKTSRIKYGLVLASVGAGDGFTYKKSRRGEAEIDRAAAHVLKHGGRKYGIVDFSPYGYDERQFCSPGFDLAVGCIMRASHGQFPEYHTSADDLEFVRSEVLLDSFRICTSVLEVIEKNATYLNQNPKCEPQLGKRGLYPSIGGSKNPELLHLAMLWVLNLSDGRHTVLDVADKAGIPFAVINDATCLLHTNGLLKIISPEPTGNFAGSPAEKMTL
jgi:aminopeptidase-like protein